MSLNNGQIAEKFRIVIILMMFLACLLSTVVGNRKSTFPFDSHSQQFVGRHKNLGAGKRYEQNADEQMEVVEVLPQNFQRILGPTNQEPQKKGKLTSLSKVQYIRHKKWYQPEQNLPADDFAQFLPQQFLHCDRIEPISATESTEMRFEQQQQPIQQQQPFGGTYRNYNDDGRCNFNVFSNTHLYF